MIFPEKWQAMMGNVEKARTLWQRRVHTLYSDIKVTVAGSVA
jgi:hypothetical protein